MKCLVIVCHPLRESLCGSLAAEAVSYLKTAGHSVEVRDLHEERFDPRLSAEERQSYYAERFAGNALSEEIKSLTETEMLVLVFPAWWFGFPAVLKGWFGRVWAPGHAYNHAADLSALKPKLQNLKQAYAITTMGSPWWVDYFVMLKPVYRTLRFALLGACAPKCRFKMISFYKCEKVSASRYEGFVTRIKKLLN
ncbi:MAG: NAD(P)H-dependent oxidoreductase [Kordiimonas sp.]